MAIVGSPYRETMLYSNLADCMINDCSKEFKDAEELLRMPSDENIEKARSIIMRLATENDYLPAVKWMAQFSENVLHDYHQAMIWYKKAAEIKEKKPTDKSMQPKPPALSLEQDTTIKKTKPHRNRRKWLVILIPLLILSILAAVFIWRILPGLSKNLKPKSESKYTEDSIIGDKVFCDISSVLPVYGVKSNSTDGNMFVCCKCDSSEGIVWLYITTKLYNDKVDTTNDVLHLGQSGVHLQTIEFSPTKRIHGIVKDAESLCVGLSSKASNLVLFVGTVDGVPFNPEASSNTAIPTEQTVTVIASTPTPTAAVSLSPTPSPAQTTTPKSTTAPKVGDYPPGVYYQQLSNLEKSIYLAVSYSAQYNVDNCTIPSIDVDRNDINVERAVTAFLYDHPECIFLTGGYVVSSDGSLLLYQYDFWKNSSNPHKYTNDLMVKVREIASKANKYSSDFKKAVYVHDYICQNCSYDSERLAESEKARHEPDADLIYTAYGCLVQGKCVCSGYAMAYKLIMDELGIECYYVSGSADIVSHAWNVVKLGKGYYHVDITFDDPMYDFSYSGNKNKLYDHVYFGLTTKAISADHFIDRRLLRIPDCTATKYNYYSYMGYTMDSYSISRMVEIINAQRKDGVKNTVIRFSNQEVYNKCTSDSTLDKLCQRLDYSFIYITNDDMRTLSIIKSG